MKHDKKKHIARKMLSSVEKENKTPIFQSKAWQIRLDAKRKKQLPKEKKTKTE